MEEGELAAWHPPVRRVRKRGRWCREETAVAAGGFLLGLGCVAAGLPRKWTICECCTDWVMALCILLE